jgi:hypothetical protein
MGVAPVVGVLGVARPLLGDTDPAGQPDLAVGHEDLAMRPVGHPARGVRLRRPEARDPHVRLAHLLDEVLLDLDAAHRIDDHVDLDARACPLTQGVGHVTSDVAAPVDVGEQAQRALGAADGVEVGGEDVVAVDQQLDLVAVGDRGAGQRLGGAQEHRVANVELVGAVEVVAVAALAAVA